MASKNINILLSLKDQFTPKLKGTTKEIRAQQKQINAATKTITNWGKNANNVFKRVMSTAGRAAGVLATLGGAISVAGVVNFANEAIAGFNAAEEAETKLEAVLGNVPSIMSQGADAARRAKDELVDLTDQMEENGVVAGDVSVAGLQQLATFQLSQKTLEKLAPGMADLIAQQKGLNATQSDAVSIGNMIGKVMNGQTSALSRAGIIMSDDQEQVLKTGTEEQKAATLADVLAQNVGGVNKALAETDAGKVAVAQNLIGRSTDLIGEKIMNIKGQLADLLIQHMPQIQEAALGLVTKVGQWIENNKETISNAFDTIMKVGKFAFETIGGAISFFIQNANWLLPVLAGVVGGFAAFNVISKVASIFSTLITVIRGAATAGGILNAVMAANPFGAIAIAIGAVITVITLLIANWDKVKEVAQTVIEAIVGFVTTLKDAVVQLATEIKDGIVGAFNWVKDKVSGVFDWFGDKIGGIVDGIKSIPDKIKGFFGFGDGGGHATGTPYFKGGMTRINEGGRGEIVDLPNGTRIIPHDVAKKAAQAGSAPSVVVNLTIQGNVIGNRQYMEQTGDYIAKKILAAQGVV